MSGEENQRGIRPDMQHGHPDSGAATIALNGAAHGAPGGAAFDGSDVGEERPLRSAMLRGWRCRCPACGAGPLLQGYLKVRDTCPACGEDLHHHRADDGPAYLTILIVGHVMAPLLLIAFTVWRPSPLTLALTFSVFCVALSGFLLPRLKGMIVAIQWSRRMHGFGQAASQA